MDTKIQSYLFFCICVAILFEFIRFVIEDSKTVPFDPYSKPQSHARLIVEKALLSVGEQQRFQLKNGNSFNRYIVFVDEIGNTIAISINKDCLVYEWIDAELIKDIRKPL